MAELTVNEIQSINVNYYITLISFTLLVHEYCLTFIMEVERFWSARRFTWAALFFYLNRYFTLFGHVPVVVEYFLYSTADKKSTICRDLQSYHQYFSVIVQIWVATLLCMRMYAIYFQSRQVLALIVGIVLAATIVACWSILTGKKENITQYFPPMGCTGPLSHYAAIRLAIAWGGMLVLDTTVFLMTAYKSLLFRKESGMNLLTLMLRDGTIYFGVMIAANIANILTFLYGDLFTRGAGTTFTNVISSVMTTRFMLNLRDPTVIQGYPDSTSISRPVFRTRQATSTHVDFHSRESENFSSFPQSDHHTLRHSLDNDNHGLTRTAELGRELGARDPTE